MTVSKMINKLRVDAKLTQEQFAERFSVTQQTVQKWESGRAVPGMDKLVAIAKEFGITLDLLVLGDGGRAVEENRRTKIPKPAYENVHNWEFYSAALSTEYEQCVDEGLDVESYRELFSTVGMLPNGEIKKKLGDVIYEIVSSAPQRKDYPFVEPSELEQIRSLRLGALGNLSVNRDELPSRVAGAWYGRIAGCMLGKTLEGITTDELVPFLRGSDNYPMRRYVYSTDITPEVERRYKFRFNTRCYADALDGMPADDDTNYTVMGQLIIENYGRDFTPGDVARAWLRYQPKDAYCTAERVAFCNFVKGYQPPESAIYKNPYREWIGAQIRADYYGYINPGNPALAAEMAWRDASISHIKNGIYGEMLVAAMLAVAATTSDAERIIRGGIAEIPATSRLYRDVSDVLDAYKNGVSQSDVFAMIHERYDEFTSHGWCHTNSNAMIVAASLLYGEGDFGKSVCMAVETGFDTDCNGATVGSVFGMAHGASDIPEYWTKPFGDKLNTQIFGITEVTISDCAKKTLEHIG